MADGRSMGYRVLRGAFFGVLALAALAMTVGGAAWLFDFRWEGNYEQAIREYASVNRLTDLRFPGAEWSAVRPVLRRDESFDLTASALSIAEQELTDDLEKHPSDSRLLMLRAQIHLLYLQANPAIDILNRLRPFAQTDPELLGALGYAHYLRGRQENRLQDILRGIDFFEAALKEKPGDPVLLFNAGTAYQRARMLAKADGFYQQMLEAEAEGGWAREVRNRMKSTSQAE